MKKLFTPFHMLLATLDAGVLGFLLQLWLVIATTDDKGLLRIDHISSVLSFLLLGGFLLLLVLYVRKTNPGTGFQSLIAGGPFPATGAFFAACGIGYTAIAAFGVRKDIVSWIVLITGIVAALSMVALGLCRLQKKRPGPLPQGLVAVFLAVYLLEQYRSWCKEPQLAAFFFPLLACVFLLLATYHGAVLDTKKDNCRRYIFFNRAAILLCCLGLCHSSRVLFTTMALYMACSIRIFPKTRKTEEA